MAILVVGSIAFDTVSTPEGKRSDILGGSALYFSLVASKFTPVLVEAVVGRDFTDEEMRILDGENIDRAGIRRVDGKTFRWEGEYNAAGDDAKTVSLELNVFGEHNPLLPPSYRSVENLFLANIDPDRQLSVLGQMEGNPRISTDTRDHWILSKLESLRDLIAKTDILFINEGEARLLTGREDLRDVSAAILEQGPASLIIKKGKSGASLYTKDHEVSVPAFPVKRVVDPTGAGDSFAGGFLGCLANMGNADPGAVREALLAGTAAASFAIEEFGVSRLKEITAHDIRERMAILR